MYGRPAPARTAFAVERTAQAPVETLAGGRHAWRFRPHFHAGDEVVRMLAGRALLRLPDGCREVVAGEVPSPLSPPSGCTFHTRCPLAQAQCKAERPELRQKPDGSRVACHFA